MTDLPLERLEELEGLRKLASAGPWDHSSVGGLYAPVLHRWTESGCCGQVLDSGECCGNAISQDAEAWDSEQIASTSPNDAAYIAALVNAAPDLIRAAREGAEAKAQLAESESENARWLLRLADIREAAGVGSRPMLAELPVEIAAMRAQLAEAREALRRIAEERCDPVSVAVSALSIQGADHG